MLSVSNVFDTVNKLFPGLYQLNGTQIAGIRAQKSSRSRLLCFFSQKSWQSSIIARSFTVWHPPHFVYLPLCLRERSAYSSPAYKAMRECGGKFKLLCAYAWVSCLATEVSVYTLGTVDKADWLGGSRPNNSNILFFQPPFWIESKEDRKLKPKRKQKSPELDDPDPVYEVWGDIIKHVRNDIGIERCSITNKLFLIRSFLWCVQRFFFHLPLFQ